MWDAKPEEEIGVDVIWQGVSSLFRLYSEVNGKKQQEYETSCRKSEL